VDLLTPSQKPSPNGSVFDFLALSLPLTHRSIPGPRPSTLAYSTFTIPPYTHPSPAPHRLPELSPGAQSLISSLTPAPLVHRLILRSQALKPSLPHLNNTPYTHPSPATHRSLELSPGGLVLDFQPTPTAFLNHAVLGPQPQLTVRIR